MRWWTGQDWALGVWGVALLVLGLLLLCAALGLMLVLAWQARSHAAEHSRKLDAIYATLLGSLVAALERTRAELIDARQAIDKMDGFISAHDAWERERWDRERNHNSGQKRRVTDLSPFAAAPDPEGLV